MKKLIIIIIVILFSTSIGLAKLKYDYITLKEGQSSVISGGALNNLEVIKFQDKQVQCYIISTKVDTNIVNNSISCVK